LALVRIENTGVSDCNPDWDTSARTLQYCVEQGFRMLYISEDILAQLSYALVLASKSTRGSVAFVCIWVFHACERRERGEGKEWERKGWDGEC
jgi:hypothetical protein